MLASLNARSALRDQMCHTPTLATKTQGQHEEDHARSIPLVCLTRICAVLTPTSLQSLEIRIGTVTEINDITLICQPNPRTGHDLVTIDHDA